MKDQFDGATRLLKNIPHDETQDDEFARLRARYAEASKQFKELAPPRSSTPQPDLEKAFRSTTVRLRASLGSEQYQSMNGSIANLELRRERGNASCSILRFLRGRGQAKNRLPHDMLFGSLERIGGLLCRKHAQHSMRLPRAQGWPAGRAHWRFLASAAQHVLT